MRAFHHSSSNVIFKIPNQNEQGMKFGGLKFQYRPRYFFLLIHPFHPLLRQGRKVRQTTNAFQLEERSTTDSLNPSGGLRPTPFPSSATPAECRARGSFPSRHSVRASFTKRARGCLGSLRHGPSRILHHHPCPLKFHHSRTRHRDTRTSLPYAEVDIASPPRPPTLTPASYTWRRTPWLDAMLARPNCRLSLQLRFIVVTHYQQTRKLRTSKFDIKISSVFA